MKLTTPFKKVLLICMWAVLGFASKAQTYELYVTNVSQPTTKQIKFDVYLLRTGGTELEMSGMQFGLGFDTSITNGGTLTFAFQANSSSFSNQAQSPTAFSLGSTAQVFNVGGTIYRYMNQAARPLPGAGSGSIISNVKTACTSPGTRVGTYTLNNTNNFKSNVTPKFAFSAAAAAGGRTQTKVTAYVSGTSVDATGTQYSYSTLNTCDVNTALNPCNLTPSPNHTNLTCFANLSGTASAGVTGSPSALDYVISGPTVNTTGASTGNFTGLSAGTYVISYSSSAYTCAGNTGNIVITQPTLLKLNEEHTAASCPGGPSTVTISGEGGTPSYTYSNGVTSNSTGIFTQTSGTSVNYTVTDGNSCTVTESVSVANGVDATNPSISSCGSNQSANATSGCQAVVPNFTSSVVATDNCTSSGSLVITQSPLAGTLSGSTTVTITVKDAANNTSTCTRTFTVNDATAPSITTCASNQSTSANESGNATVPDFTSGVTATDACSGVTVTQSPVAGTTVGVGSHTITLTATDASNNSSTCEATFTVASGCNFTVADSIVGALNACPFASPGTTNNGTYSIAATSVSTYNWTVSSPTTMTIVSGQGTGSIQVHYASTFVSGTISVTLTSACGGTVTKTTNTITKKVPAVPGTISGPINVCTYFGTPITYTIAPVANAITYRWTLPANVTIQSATSDSTSITVIISSSFMSNASTAKSIKVKAISGCGNSADKTLALLTAAPITPGVISGPVNVCPYVNAATVATYTIRKVANASSYIWSVPTGATITSHPGGSGTANDTIITVSYDNNIVATTADPNSVIKVQASSACGTSLAKSLALKRTLPAAPGAITGPLNVCPLMEGSIETNGIDTVYKIKRVIDVTSYNWGVPTGVTIVAHPGGAGTATDTIIRVHFTSAFTSGSITVSSTNGCGTSINKVLAIKRLLPATPGTITGTVNPCPTIGGPDTTTYRIKKALNALSYNWSVPTGGQIMSHPGGEGTVNDTIIIVRWTSAFTTGNVAVTSQNNCATSAPKTLAIVRKLPAVPGTISGLTNPCPTMGSPVTYSIAALPLNATHVLWTAPSGASIVGADDQLSVQIVYTTGFTTGAVSVVGVNQCTSSLPKTLNIVRVLPATPGTITPSVTAAAAQAQCPNRVINYSIASMPLNSVSLVWTVPSGATYEVLSATSIAVTYPSTAVSGAVTVAGKNGCDQVGTAKSLTVTLAACPVGGGVATKVDTKTPTVKPTIGLESIVFPNPSTSSFKLNVTSPSKEKITVRVMDAMGRPYKMMNMTAGETINFGSDLKTGTYFVEIIQGSTRTTQQIIKL